MKFRESGVAEKLSVNCTAHMSSALISLLVGITCLKNLRLERHERNILAVSATVFVVIGSAVV